MGQTWGAQVRKAERDKRRKEAERKRRERRKLHPARRAARTLRDWW